LQQASAAAHIRYSATTWRQRHTMSLSWRAIRCSDLPTAASSPCIGRVVYFRASGGSGWTMFLSGGRAAHVRSGRVGLCSAEAMQGAIGTLVPRHCTCSCSSRCFLEVHLQHRSATPPAPSLPTSPLLLALASRCTGTHSCNRTDIDTHKIHTDDLIQTPHTS